MALKPEAAPLPGHDEAAMKTLRDRMDGFEDADLRSRILRSGKVSQNSINFPLPFHTGLFYSHFQSNAFFFRHLKRQKREKSDFRIFSQYHL